MVELGHARALAEEDVVSKGTGNVGFDLLRNLGVVGGSLVRRAVDEVLVVAGDT